MISQDMHFCVRCGTTRLSTHHTECLGCCTNWDPREVLPTNAKVLALVRHIVEHPVSTPGGQPPLDCFSDYDIMEAVSFCRTAQEGVLRAACALADWACQG